MSASVDRSLDTMEKIKIKENVYQYYFASRKNDEANSIFALLDEKRQRALLIDTAYPAYAEQVKKDLITNNITVEAIVFSHYHPDHTAGCSVFPDCRIYASRFYDDNYFNCSRWEPEYTYIRPTHLVADGEQLDYGDFKLTFIEAPGHSTCNLFIRINEDVLHVSDVLMFNNENKPCLPYISMGGTFREHIQTLKRLQTMTYHTLIMAHGHPLNGKEEALAQIDHRLYYLEKLLNSNGSLALAGCLKEKYSFYANQEFHDNNLLHLMMEPE